MMELYRSLSESFRSQQEYDGKKYFCTISAGSASYPEDASGYTELSEYASHSLKYAKSSAETGSSFSAAPSSNRKCVRWSWWNCCARASSGSSKGLSLSISRRVAVEYGGMWWARKRWPAGVHERTAPCSPGEFIPLQVGIPGGRSTVQGMDEKPP